MIKNAGQTLDHIVESYSLHKLTPPVDLFSLAAAWGAVSIEQREISSDAMLLPAAEGYKVILKKAYSSGERVRQRFSFAHELGHLLLRQLGYDKRTGSGPMQRGKNADSDEERLCDKIAAEILLPRTAFMSDASQLGWSINGIKCLTRKYNVSVQATASRIVSLTPEMCLMGVWKASNAESEPHKLLHSFGRTPRYAIPNSNRMPRIRLWLISRAAKSVDVENGIGPLVDRARRSAQPEDVPAEAWAWGKDDFRRVLVFYYPERELTEDMRAVAKAIWRAF